MEGNLNGKAQPRALLAMINLYKLYLVHTEAQLVIVPRLKHVNQEEFINRHYVLL